MKRKKGLLAVLLLPVMLFLCTVQSTASDAPYQFRFEEEPEEVADDAYEEYLQNLPPEVPVGGSFSCIPLYKKCPAGDPAEHLIHNIFFLCSFNTNPDRSAAHNLFREVPFYVPDIQGMPTPSYLSTDVFLCHIPVHSRFSSDAFLRCLIHIHVLCKD